MEASENMGQATSLAVIGLVGRFPGAGTVEQFWENLRTGVESITFFTDEELTAGGVDASVYRKPNYVRAAAALEGVELFDAGFFGITPREAEVMDPQQRLFLECAWHGLEDAGYDAERYNGSIGVYAGVGLNTYWMNLLLNPRVTSVVSRFQLGLVNDKDHLPTRVSYKLNLKGPSVNVQTACSTSLVAVHMACQSLLNAECDIALAGGVSIALPQKAGYFYEEGGINSPDGRCRAFDERAQGTVGGSGVGVVVLKRLVDAINDGDCIRAVILGSAINNDGSQKVGYTAPSIEGQAKAIAEALSVARVSPESISYVEAHGTGTSLGDPIEVAALTQAYRAYTDKRTFCAIGSVKTNIGHLDAAAGVAGLIKTVLALHNRLLPPSLHFTTPNPKIDFATSPFYVNRELGEWPGEGRPRRAGVSSFGVGGTNAHIILEEAPAIAPAGSSRPAALITLSARTSSALGRMMTDLAQHLRRRPDVNLADAAYTHQIGRRAFPYRCALVCRDGDEAIAALEERQRANHDPVEENRRPLFFMFPGEGSQRVGMAGDLYRSESVFRSLVDECSERLAPELGLDLRVTLYPDASEIEEAGLRLTQTRLAQPALFVVEYSLAQLWKSWGASPSAMIGHNIGEYVAACLAGVFSLEDALKLVAARGRLMQQAEPRAMTATLVEAFTELTRRVNLQPPTLAYLSNLSGSWITEQEATDPAYWARHLHVSARFGDGLSVLLMESGGILLEVGPGRALSLLAQRRITGGQLSLSSLPHGNEQGEALSHTLGTLGKLWTAGVAVDWKAFYADQRRRRVSLPTYPFERRRYWVDPLAAPPIDQWRPAEDDDQPTASDLAPAVDSPNDEDALERLFEQQLRIMSEQLCVLDEPWLEGETHA